MDLTDEEQGLFMPPNELDNNETYRERYSVEDRTINTKFKTAALFYVSVLAVFSLILNVHKGLDVGKSDIGRQVDAILTATPLIDGHNDFAIWLRVFYGNKIEFNETSTIDGMVDIPRMRQGRLAGQFWSVYMPCPSLETDFSSEVYYEIIHDTLQQIDLIRRLTDIFPNYLTLVSSVNEARRSFRNEAHRVVSLMGVEGLHQIGNSASILRLYHQLGVRYVTLTHDCNNKYADAALSPYKVNHGLSAAGEEMVHEMNRLGMIVDLSHTSDDTMRDALATSRAPVIFSHSNARAVCHHVRNVPDDILYDLRQNGGVVMVTFYPEYTNCQNSSDASLGDVIDHIVYIGRLIGFEHVGIGSDFDGMSHGPRGLEDVSRYPNLIRELLRSGMSSLEIGCIIGNNIMRVWEEVDRIAKEMRNLRPLEDEVKEMPHFISG